MVAAHYRSHVEFSFEALEEAAAGFQRIEGFLERVGAARRAGRVACPQAFVDAMDDDLGTPAAVGVIHDTVRAGNKALADGPSRRAARANAAEVRAMLGVLGLDPADPHWDRPAVRTT